MAKHAHFWEIDGSNLGVCKHCGATRQFPVVWKPNFNHKERTTIEQWEPDYIPTGYHLVEVK